MKTDRALEEYLTCLAVAVENFVQPNHCKFELKTLVQGIDRQIEECSSSRLEDLHKDNPDRIPQDLEQVQFLHTLFRQVLNFQRTLRNMKMGTLEPPNLY